jgi:hypothetical protein
VQHQAQLVPVLSERAKRRKLQRDGKIEHDSVAVKQSQACGTRRSAAHMPHLQTRHRRIDVELRRITAGVSFREAPDMRGSSGALEDAVGGSRMPAAPGR